MVASGTQLCLPQSWHRYLCCPSTKFITTNYYQQILPQSFFTTNYDIATFGSSHDLHTDHLVHFFQIIITKMVSIKMVIKAALRKKLYYVGRIPNNQLDFFAFKMQSCCCLFFLARSLHFWISVSSVAFPPGSNIWQLCTKFARQLQTGWCGLLCFLQL